MKAFFGTVLLILGLMSCSSQRTLESQPPFSVERPTVQYWEGAVDVSGSHAGRGYLELSGYAGNP